MGHHAEMYRFAEKLKPESRRTARRIATDSRIHERSYEPLRHHKDDVLHEQQDFRIRLADSDGRRSNVSLLINRMYSWRGYETSVDELTARSPNRITLEASRHERVFGTLTVGLEGPQVGLQVDQLYRDEIDAIRSQGRKICEFIRLAVDPKDGSKEVLSSLFHLAFIYACKIHRCDDIAIEVNPRHVLFYKRMLGFEQAGPERICERVGAPAVLMRLAGSYAAEQIALHGGHRSSSSRSLYPYFFSKQEEEGLCARLQRLA